MKETGREADTLLSSADLWKSTSLASRKILGRDCRVPESLLDLIKGSCNCRYPLRIVRVSIVR